MNFHGDNFYVVFKDTIAFKFTCQQSRFYIVYNKLDLNGNHKLHSGAYFLETTKIRHFENK